MLAAIGATRTPIGHREYVRIEDEARAALGAEAFAMALAAGQALTLERAIAEATSLRDALKSTPPAPSPRVLDDAACPLTARELEVAKLIARGLTNKQIAAELVIAEGTADRHVSNILGKLGFSTRAQVAAWAAGQ